MEHVELVQISDLLFSYYTKYSSFNYNGYTISKDFSVITFRICGKNKVLFNSFIVLKNFWYTHKFFRIIYLLGNAA